MNWLEKYKPKRTSDFHFFKKEIEECKRWMENYKNKKEGRTPVLYLKGGSGLGKTILAQVLLKEFGYDMIELNTTDFKGKKLSEYLKKTLVYKNVIDMFHEGTRPVGILLDEIDNFCKVSDKSIITEFIQILKCNQITENKKNKKKEEMIQLYNPILCTSSDMNDKKLNEIQKYSHVVVFSKHNITLENYTSFVRELYKKEGKEITADVIPPMVEYAQGDIRRFIQMAEELYLYAHDKETVDKNVFEQYKKIYTQKELDIQLVDATEMLFREKLSIQTCQSLFDMDCLQMPLMIYQNIPSYMKMKKHDSNMQAYWKVYEKLMEVHCIHDTIQTNIFENQEWDTLYEICSIYGTVLPNAILHQVPEPKKPTKSLKSIKSTKTKQNQETTSSDKMEIQTTNVLNKMSQMILNNKLLQNITPFFGRINKDYNEYIYIIKMMNDSLEEIKEKDTGLHVHHPFISFLNYYKINVDMLENILKLEKLNSHENKKKKKFTIKLKKRLNEYLQYDVCGMIQSANEDEEEEDE
jgi:DNA polymerase III delta prime subunit